MKKKIKATKGKKNGKRRLLKLIRKDASAFLSSEEGKIVKKDIVKMALAMGLTAASLGSSEAAHTNNAHVDNMNQRLHNDGASSGHYSGHGNAAHGDHSNHGSHSSGGWC